ncbi:MAG TPA: thioredoxin domain-containing protein, partial [Gemmataceae bacterium]|nr:thioredoxin domain-containing protein [Gemmataceae bacterium]
MSVSAAGTNRLGNESSLYLRQHAQNPVDWYPWGPEALGRARELDRPIFLSIGYSACHWCHVMEHESFEDAETAKILNEHFVPIKVDREERPDLDAIYMNAVQMLNQGQGGWPMSVWLTPELRPFYAGTYYPPRDMYGRPSFRRVLLALVEAWRDRRDEITQAAGHITDHLQKTGELPVSAGQFTEELFRRAVGGLKRAHDPVHGGFGHAPKFPHALDLRVLLRAWKRFGDEDALAVARLTLDKMARGGIYDHLGGGFHRYSVDERWLVPHFEKMLYDNALLSVAYLEAFQATGESFYRQVVEETLDYVLREMTDASGAFYSTQDADSEGEEGKFYVWSEQEIEAVLGKELSDVFNYVYGVSRPGNWEGHNILNRAKTDEQDARLLKTGVEDLRVKLGEAKKKLYAVRSRRVWPGRDEKFLTAWNGMLIVAFAKAGAVLEREDYTRAAERAGEFILKTMRGQDGRLFRTAGAGTPPKLNAYLEDYAFAIDAMAALYEATFAVRWLRAAEELAGVMVEQFADTNDGFFTTGADHELLLVRMKDQHDGSTPSGNSVAITALLQLAKLTGTDRWRQTAERAMTAMAGVMEQHPLAAGQLFVALDYWLGPVEEIA